MTNDPYATLKQSIEDFETTIDTQLTGLAAEMTDLEREVEDLEASLMALTVDLQARVAALDIKNATTPVMGTPLMEYIEVQGLEAINKRGGDGFVVITAVMRSMGGPLAPVWVALMGRPRAENDQGAQAAHAEDHPDA